LQLFIRGGVEFDRTTNLGQAWRYPDQQEHCQPADKLSDALANPESRLH
jgi:hypothetical protein